MDMKTYREQNRARIQAAKDAWEKRNPDESWKTQRNHPPCGIRRLGIFLKAGQPAYENNENENDENEVSQ